MGFRINKKDFFWGYAAQFLNIGAGVLLLPVLLRTLSPADVGLWFVFLTVAGLSQLLEFGFQPTISRNVAYVCSGATVLNKTGVPHEVIEGGVDPLLFRSLVEASRRIYQRVAVIAFLVLIPVGSCYVYSVLVESQGLIERLVAWLLFAAGYVLMFYFGYINAVLLGRGDNAQNNKVIVLSRLLLIVFASVFLLLDFGMLGLGVASFISSLLSRFVAYHYLVRGGGADLVKTPPELESKVLEMVHLVWHNSKQLGVVQLGAFLIQRGNVLVVSSFLGLEVASSYSITLTILLVLSTFSAVICNLQVPYLSQLQAVKDKHVLPSVFGEILCVSWVFYFLGFFALYFFGEDFLNLIGSKSTLLQKEVFFVLGLVLFLEMNHSLCAIYLTTKNTVPFVFSAVVSGFSVLLLSLGVVSFMEVWGVVLSQGLVQIVYNNWKWPREVSIDLGVPFFRLLILGGYRIRSRLFSKDIAA